MMICNKCGHRLPGDSEFCQYCGSKIRQETAEVVSDMPTPSQKTGLGEKVKEGKLSTQLIISLILSSLALVCIIVAMNSQDYLRLIHEPMDPNIFYFILIFCYVLYIALILFLKKPVEVKSLFAVAPAFLATISIIQGSVFSTGYSSYSYDYVEIVGTFNTLWVIFTFALLAVNMVCMSVMKWRKTISYREYCYKRVVKMKEYMEKGIISQDEYEKNREDILKNIKIR